MWRNVASVLPKTDLAVRAIAAPFAVPGQTAATVAVVAQVELPVQEAAEALVVDAELLVYAYDMKGKQDGADRTTFRIEAKGTTKQTVAHEVLSRLRSEARHLPAADRSVQHAAGEGRQRLL